MAWGCTSKPSPPAIDAGLPTGGQRAAILGMWEESGTLSALHVPSRSLLPYKAPISNDAVARYYDGYLYIINRLTHDNIQVMNAKTWSLHAQYSVGQRSNPQDIAFVSPSKAYVSRLNDPSILIVEPKTGKQTGAIDLRSLSEMTEQVCATDADCDSKVCIEKRCAQDGMPELAQMLIHGKKLFVAVQRLNRNKRFTAQHTGLLAVIDTQTDKVLKTIQLAGKNPTQLIPTRDGASVYVVQVGNWMKGPKVVLDGGIEQIDLVTLKSKGWIIRESELGGNLSSVALLSKDKAYAIRSRDQWKTELVALDLRSKNVTHTLAQSECVEQNACFTFFQIRLSASGELYLVDRHLKKPGIRVFSTNSNQEITRKPIDTGIPPSSIVFYP